jgi:hypothetical protein
MASSEVFCCIFVDIFEVGLISDFSLCGVRLRSWLVFSPSGELNDMFGVDMFRKSSI